MFFVRMEASRHSRAAGDRYCWLATEDKWRPNERKWCRTTYRAFCFDTEAEAKAAAQEYAEEMKDHAYDDYGRDMLQRIRQAEIVAEVPPKVTVKTKRC